MKKRLVTIIIFALLVLAGEDWYSSKMAGFVGTTKPATQTLNLKVEPQSAGEPLVTRVIDGDTIVVLINGISEKVRLIGVDTPETVDPRKMVQCFGKEASAFTKNLLLNSAVQLEADTSQGDRDKYGRLLRYVFLSDGTLVNKEIIVEGYGYEYTYRIPYKYQNDFKNSEKSAREMQKGLWANEACGLQNTK